MNTRHGFRIFTIRGIPVRIHYTFLLILPFLAFAFGQGFAGAARLASVHEADLSGSPWAWGLLLALALFASVLVHELAHSLYALAHGGKVRSITLLVLGGVSEIAEMPHRPSQEALMALAGPAASLVIGGACFALLWVMPGMGDLDVRFGLFCLGQLNLALGVFNLLPAFPMDGGRILRAVLVRSRGPTRATQIAATVGKVFAVAFALAGLLAGNYFLAIIAFFVFIGAEGEQHALLTRAVLGELRVAELMTPQPAAERVRAGDRTVTPAGVATSAATRIGPHDRVADVLRLFADRSANELSVVEEGRLVGTVSRSDVVRILRLQEFLASQHPAAAVLAPGEHPA